MDPVYARRRDSPLQGGNIRREGNQQVQDFFSQYATQGKITTTPGKMRPSPATRSPQDVDHSGAPVMSFPHQPGRNTPGNQRRQSADRRGNSPTSTPTSNTQWRFITCSCGHQLRTQKYQKSTQCQACGKVHTAGTPMGGGGTPERRHAEMQQKQQQLQQQQQLNLLDQVLQKLIEVHIRKAPTDACSTIEGAMIQIEKAFWQYLDDFSSNNLLPKFERGLLKDFTVEILKREPNLCNLWPDDSPPMGGLDNEKDEVNKKKVAVLFHRKLCEYKMSQPVAGGVLMNDKMTHLLMVRNSLCPNGWTFPKTKLKKDETAEEAAIRSVQAETSFCMEPAMTRAKKVVIEVDRSIVVQTQTLFIIAQVSDTDVVLKEGASAWRPISSMPYIDSIVKQAGSSLVSKTKPPLEYETASLFMKGIAKELADVVQHLKSGGNLGGPAVKVPDVPKPLLDYNKSRSTVMTQTGLADRWPSCSSPAPALPEKASARVGAVRKKLAADFAKILQDLKQI
eukprot:TRINITY_DN7478_c0_g1_i1.p1 TRINITY_DN7478_c0_g1~~TRINITY_DN7478_c0_g1_i1.p1  ORF type:complete len:508 (+),score=77.63 TRINITY_DN7478_c0_g1_i1:46-1569(+)